MAALTRTAYATVSARQQCMYAWASITGTGGHVTPLIKEGLRGNYFSFLSL